MYAGRKHSSCSRYINERGGKVDKRQMLTDHARRESVKKVAGMGGEAERALMSKSKKARASSGHPVGKKNS